LRRLRVAWGITGAGDQLVQTVEAMERVIENPLVQVKTFASRNAEIVIKWYKLWNRLQDKFGKVAVERGPNQPFIAGALQTGRYDLLFVSPATANTTAKIAHGIADSLVSNCVAQAVKGGTPVYICPVDWRMGSLETEIPGGRRIRITTRRVDVQNVETVRSMEGITVLEHPGQIEAVVSSAIHKKRLEPYRA